MTRAFVGIGANVGDPAAQVQAGLSSLAAIPQTRLVAASSLYRTAPLGYTAQADFVNAAALLETGLGARALLGHLQRIEAAAGRARPGLRHPRARTCARVARAPRAGPASRETVSAPGRPRREPRARSARVVQ